MDVQDMLLARIEREKAAKASEICDGFPFCCVEHAQKHLDWLNGFGENSDDRGAPWWWKQRDKAEAIVKAAELKPTGVQSARQKLMAEVRRGCP